MKCQIFRALFIYLMPLALLMGPVDSGHARRAAPKTVKQAAPPAAKGETATALRCNAKGAVLMEGITGKVLYEQDSRLQIPPASFVKIMTLYIVYDAIGKGELKLDEEVTVSEKAWRIQGSKMFIGVGERVKVEDLIKGIAIVSGNDACVAIAEHLAGSEDLFVARMNQKAEALGMKDSRFRNASGMPDPEQLTTAMDMAVLSSRYIQDHPDSLAVHSTIEYEYNGIKQGNRNLLLYKNIGVDGLKTGHVDGAGYHLAATAKRGDQRMIAVVMGAERAGIRAAEAQKLLEHGFRNFVTVQPVKAGDSFGPVRVSRGKAKEIMLQAAAGVTAIVAKGKEKSVNATPELPESVRAPVQKGQAVGKIIVKEEDRVIQEIDLLAAVDVPKSLLFSWQMILVAAGGLVLIAAGLIVMVRRPRSRRSLM